jgi:hypothetical protein
MDENSCLMKHEIAQHLGRGTRSLKVTDFTMNDFYCYALG